MRIITSILILNILFSLVNPQTVHLLPDDNQTYSSNTYSELSTSNQDSSSLLDQINSTTIFLPIVAGNTIPPRENITLSVFSANEPPEVYEKNLDENGIPILVDGFKNGNGYHPTYICRYTLYVAAAYEINPNNDNYRKIQNLMTWIKDNKVERDNYITWEFVEDLPSFNQKAPWTSALTNAWCSAALLQGYKITGNEKLETLARAGLEYLFIPVSDGGGLYEFENGDIWFEEYPSTENPSHVLNGFIYAMDVLDMFSSYYESARYQDLFDRAVVSLVKRIDQYDVGYGSIYDLYTRGNKLGMGYHPIHILQLYYLYLRTENPHLLEVSQKWYALQNQSKYELLETPATPKDLSVIHDGNYWSNYVKVKLPIEFSFTFDKVYKLYGVNFFLYNDNNPTHSMALAYVSEDGSYIAIPPVNYSVEWTGSNTTPNGHVTNVYSLTFNEAISTQSLIFKLEKTAPNDAGVFREIGIWKNMNDDYWVEYKRLHRMEDIVNKRIQLINRK
jgi:hypothetical protein